LLKEVILGATRRRGHLETSKLGLSEPSVEGVQRVEPAEQQRLPFADLGAAIPDDRLPQGGYSLYV
jgi:hypothetical protein